MRIILGLVLFSCSWLSLSVAQQTTLWQFDLEAAKRIAQQTGRPVLVHFWAPWCGPCHQLEQTVFNQPGFEQALATLCVPVKLNVDTHSALATQYGVSQIPTDVLVAPDGHLIERMACGTTMSAYLTNVQQAVGRSRGITPAAPTYGTQPFAAAPLAQAPPANPYPHPQGMSPSAGMPPGAPSAGPPVQPPVQPWPGAANSFPAPVGPPGGPQQPNPPMVVQSFTAQPQQPAPLGLDGYCPVALCEQHKWVPGVRDWGCVYRGRTYLFSTEQAKQKFWNNPDRYAPIASGVDPVLAIEHGQDVPGQRAHGVFFEDRVYLFASEESLEKFRQNPDRYAAEILQARR
jgi:YHS domain-containing protein/thiol-disulfide isomerase/thioredoxin